MVLGAWVFGVEGGSPLWRWAAEVSFQALWDTDRRIYLDIGHMIGEMGILVLEPFHGPIEVLLLYKRKG